MHDITTISKKPNVARRLLDFVNLGVMNVNDELLELAKTDLVSNNYNLSEEAMKGLQFIEDRNGRCIALEINNNAIKPSLIHTLSNDKFPLLILTTKPENFLGDIAELMPDKKVVIGEGNCMAEASADIFILPLNSVYKTPLLRKNRFKQLIIDKGIALSHGTTVTNAQFVCREITSSIIIMNVKSLIKNSKDEVLTSEQILERYTWNTQNDIYIMLSNVLAAEDGNVFGSMLCESIFGRHERLERHLTSQGYPTDKRLFLPLFNICTDFI